MELSQLASLKSSNCTYTLRSAAHTFANTNERRREREKKSFSPGFSGENVIAEAKVSYE